MNPIDRSIASAGRRIFIQDSLTALGWAALAGVLLDTLLLLTGRLLAVPVAWWGYVIVAGLALLIAPITAWTRRPDRAAIAAMIDHRLKLKDRLATALYAANLTHDPFARRVVEDASATAADLRIGEGFALRLHRVWGYVPPAGALLALMALLVPQADLLGFNAARIQQRAQQAAAAQATEQVGEVVTAIQKLSATTPELKDNEGDADLQQQLQEMTRADLRDPEMRKNMAARLSDVESKLGQTVDQKQQQFQSLQNTMSRLETKVPGPANSFTDALRRGDFDAARKELDQLTQAAPTMSDANQQATAEQLKSLSEQLDQAAKDAAAEQAHAQQQAAQALKNAGVSQQKVQQLQQQNFNPQAVQQALQQQGVSQQQSQQVQQQVQQSQQQSKDAGQNSSATKGIASPLGRMAQSMSQQPGSSGSVDQQQMQQAAGAAGQQLSQMAQMKQQLQQLRQSQSQTRQAMQSLSKSGVGGSPNPGQASLKKDSGDSGDGGGIGGTKAGTGAGGPPLGQERKIEGYQTDAQGDIGQGNGRVIASWLENGPMAKGAPRVSYDQAITAARKDAEQAVTEDRVPKRYHEAIKEYFNQVPDSADRIAPPPAPR